jgi:hypothetical protein
MESMTWPRSNPSDDDAASTANVSPHLLVIPRLDRGPHGQGEALVGPRDQVAG